MVKAIRIHTAGGPEQMIWEDVEVGDPGPGQVRVRHTAVGLNFIDVYHRTGLYPLPLPHGLGMEGAGIVEAIGTGVTDLAEGDRVAYASPPPGSYAEARLIAADAVVKIPDGIDDETAAAMMLKGMTAQFLIRQTYRVQAGDTILIHAAAGGVGQIVCQWAKSLGATVIGTVGSPAKADLVRSLGCDHPILYREEDFVSRVAEITGGAKLPVVYDSVGADTFAKSLDCLRPRGVLVAFGQSSGPVPPLDIGVLAQKGSLFLTRPTLMSYTASRGDTVAATEDLFAVV
ncbi:MAG: quinone oxidoreductase family protein, partial [Thalassobaculaceae bacterium]